MEEVRQLVQEEGREARNLVAFHVAVDTPSRISRKPPRAGPPPRRATPRPATRLRSASAGRDKRSELRARYWALLFGDLQRAIGEIYNTVEAHENLSECQEVILVLENYTRDFKALAEWFRLKWEYDNTPPPQRPQSLAWEIRKTDFVRPESRRAYSVKSSPSVSGKNSPCLSGHNTPSGKNSPNLTGKASPASGKISPRIPGHSNTTSPKANIEFFSSKIASKITAKPEPKSVLELSRLSDIKEKESNNLNEEVDVSNNNNISYEPVEQTEQPTNEPSVELGKAKEYQNTCPKLVVIKSPKRTVLTKEDPKITSGDDISSQAKATIAKLDAMENEFLAKHLTENIAKNDNQLNLDKENENDVMTASETNNEANISEKTYTDDKASTTTESPVKSEDNFGDVSNESSCKSPDSDEKILSQEERAKEENKTDTEVDSSVLNVINMDQDCKLIQSVENMDVLLNNQSVQVIQDSNDREQSKDSARTDVKEVKKETKSVIEKLPTRPAYSQAAAKPKPITTPKPEAKSQNRLITRSKTVMEIRPNTSQKNPNRNEPRSRNPTNKCSYPFNLTTGRTSLFDAPNKTNSSKKPANRMQQSGSGDNKTLKLDTHVSKRPPRPTSLKINEKGDKKENNNIALENIKDCDEYGSSETVIPLRDVARIESSESLKTLVPDDIGNSVEVLNVEKIKGDDDGWLTVKSRRLSRESKKQLKSHWANRFHQPSATTSLPTLNMIESPKQETKEIVSNKNLDRAKSEQPENMSVLKQCDSPNNQPTKEEPKINEASKPEIVVIKPFENTEDVPYVKDFLKLEESPKSNVVLKSKAEAKETKKDLAMIRQKSDVTGLKTRSSRTRALKKDKIKDFPKSDGSELTKNRLHSSLESLTTGLARSQESTREIFDFDKWKAEFKTTFKFLEDDDQMPNHNEILKTADPSEMSEIAEMTSLIEENERKISWALDFQSEVDQQKLCEEEDLLNRQIMELQQVSDIDLDTETDDTETDAEILCEDTSACINQSTENLASLTASLEDQYETALAGMSWAERVDTLGALEALVARDPGRAQQLHAKLSQGIKRRGSLQDALRRLQAKQARAERQRNEYQTERARKIHQLLAKVEEVKVAKNQLIEEKRLRMERRLQKAAENRDQHLKDIVRKAHDEEEKLREIAFIKQLEAQNRRHEFLDQCRSHTTRLRLMRRDRLSKLEQKAAREAAVGARRQALEAARKLHVENLLEKRKERDARVEELKELKKQERDDAAREKAEGVKSRLSALAAAAALEAHALRSRIRHKQRASQQRLESHLRAVRERATQPAPARPPTTSESQEKELEEEAARLEQERKDREKQKAIKKKARKVKQKLLSTSCERCIVDDPILDQSTPCSSRIYKVINTIQHLLAPLLVSTENESKSNGVEVEEPEKKKNNKKNKKIVNGDVEKNSESNNNNKEVEKNQEEIKSDSKKRKKKNSCNDKNDKPKLSKSGSVCSSLSDMSRGSGKVEKSRTVIDIQYLERQLNELHRIIEKFDKTAIDKSSVQKVQGVKVLGQFIAVAAEREDLASQITIRALSTCAVVVARALGSCALSAAHFLSSAACVHLAKLLSDRLEKDLQSDPKEMELAKHLGDCLSIALDSVLCSTRLYEDSKDVTGEELEVLGSLRARAHTLISYLCLCGCITRAEKAGEARESIQTLLTVCADLCHPCDTDVGPERASATQSLRCALGTSVCGSRAEFCVLFAQGAGLEHSGGFVKAARTTHLLRALAELDHQIVQEAFGEGGWPLEFRAAVARLLSQHAPNDKEAPRSTALRLSNQRLDQTLSETMVLDLIALVGFVVVNNPQLQETICDGWSVIKTLCTLPANWLVSPTHSHVLLPTLVVLSDHSGAAAAIASELSTGMLEEYMKSPEAQKVKLVQVIKQGRSKKGKK